MGLKHIVADKVWFKPMATAVLLNMDFNLIVVNLKSAKKSPSTQKRKEESSKSPPQAASTPTPLKRGRAKTKTIADIDKRVLSSAKKETPAVAEKELTTPVKTRVATPGHTPMPPRVTEGKGTVTREHLMVVCSLSA